jgi:ribosomal protein S18 acetylase RimI-like enzyme
MVLATIVPMSAAAISPISINSLSKVAPQDRRELVALLIACVQGGASIGFLASLGDDEAEAYWAKVFRGLEAGERLVLVARHGDTIVGSAQLALESRPNGRHRAEVQKVMVLPTHRRKGIATRLMAEIETAARARGVRLLFLDTSDSHAGARELYDALGYAYVGGIPGYALNPAGVPEQNAIYYKTLEP